MGAARRNRARRPAARWGLENATATTTRVRARRGLGELTELGNGRRCGAEGAGDEARAAALGRGRRRVEAGGLRASGRRGSMRDDPVEVLRGQEDRRWAGSEELWRGQSSPAAVRRGNSGAAQAEVGEKRPGEVPGRAAELLRWFAGIGARRCGMARVEQSFCAGGTMGRRWLWLRGAVRWMRVRWGAN